MTYFLDQQLVSLFAARIVWVRGFEYVFLIHDCSCLISRDTPLGFSSLTCRQPVCRYELEKSTEATSLCPISQRKLFQPSYPSV